MVVYCPPPSLSTCPRRGINPHKLLVYIPHAREDLLRYLFAIPHAQEGGWLEVVILHDV